MAVSAFSKARLKEEMASREKIYKIIRVDSHFKTSDYMYTFQLVDRKVSKKGWLELKNL
jgi:hypothetical protein